MTMRIFLTAAFIWVCSLEATAQTRVRTLAQPAIRSDTKQSPTATVAPESYIIGPEDVLQIFVWHEPELTNKATVRPDGKIGLPLLNDIQASGLTTRQLQERITDSLKKYVTEPQVSVVVQEIRSQVIYVTGAVTKPGVYTLAGPMTVMEALIRAGGLAEFAKADNIQIVRKGEKQPQRFRFNFKSFSAGKDYQQNIQLQNGDMLMVPF